MESTAELKFEYKKLQFNISVTRTNKICKFGCFGQELVMF
jgi:hypothetical protein